MDTLELQLTTNMTYEYVLHPLPTKAKGILLGTPSGSRQFQLFKSIN